MEHCRMGQFRGDLERAGGGGDREKMEKKEGDSEENGRVEERNDEETKADIN